MAEISKSEYPSWIRGRIIEDEKTRKVAETLGKYALSSVCVEASCPNRGECWQKKQVTLMILGDQCTRACRFCNVSSEQPAMPSPSEPENVASAINDLAMEYVVITSVTRDDLRDKGSGQFVATVKAVKAARPGVKVELLIPDMGGDRTLLEKVALSGCDVLGHNIEIPQFLYVSLRRGADYKRSLDVLKTVKRYNQKIVVKSAIIIGLGETPEDVLGVIGDVYSAGTGILYIGQYLSPSKKHWPVKKYYTPEEFSIFKQKAEEIGFKTVRSGPMVRSSYKAYESFSDYQR